MVFENTVVSMLATIGLMVCGCGYLLARCDDHLRQILERLK